MEEESGSARPMFVESLQAMVNTGDLENITAVQEKMLARFEKTNAKLDSFNDMAEIKLTEAMAKFELCIVGGSVGRHTELLMEAKKDLHSVFRRIRLLKQRLSKRYPAGFDPNRQAEVVAFSEDPGAEDAARPNNDGEDGSSTAQEKEEGEEDEDDNMDDNNESDATGDNEGDDVEDDAGKMYIDQTESSKQVEGT